MRASRNPYPWSLRETLHVLRIRAEWDDRTEHWILARGSVEIARVERSTDSWDELRRRGLLEAARKRLAGRTSNPLAMEPAFRR